jgi:DNA-directed RNA polymerase subunit L
MSVVRVNITRREITAANVPELEKLFQLDRLPLAQAAVEIEFKGISTAALNAFRRVSMDEMIGYALKVPIDGFNIDLTTDCYMLPQFVNTRISCIRLRPQIAPEVIAKLKFKLDVSNKSAVPMPVYAGDLEVAEGKMPDSLFNPTTKIAVLQPGKRLVITGIYISTGYGRDNSIYNVACRGAYTHLDLEQYSDAEIREEDGVAADLSGYKVSCLVANPRHHLYTAILPAITPKLMEAKTIFADVCANIKDRLQFITTSVERHTEVKTSGIQYTVIDLEAGLFEGILQVPGETHTIGELLRRTIYELVPDIAYVAYTIVSHDHMHLTIRHTSDITKILLRALNSSIELFDKLQADIVAAKVA